MRLSLLLLSPPPVARLVDRLAFPSCRGVRNERTVGANRRNGLPANAFGDVQVMALPLARGQLVCILSRIQLPQVSVPTQEALCYLVTKAIHRPSE